ncbi:MAG: copper resistance protein CopC [Pyrinomonadaceae bacterium]
MNLYQRLAAWTALVLMLTLGTYTVEWQALSTDGHTMKGKFTSPTRPTNGGKSRNSLRPK